MTAKSETVRSETAKGAQPGNTNALTHGLRISAARLELGTLPKCLKRCERNVRGFRAMLEAAVVDAHGNISIGRACKINSACRWELAAQVAMRAMRQDPAADKVALAEKVARASSARDAAISGLDLDGTAKSVWDSLLTHSHEGDDTTTEPTQTDAAAGRVEAQESNTGEVP